MGKTPYRKKENNRLPPFVPITWDILNSAAYRELAHAAAKALPYFLGKVKGVTFKDPQRHLIKFPFSYSEGKRYGFAYSTFSKVIQELVGKGFIDPVDKGGLRGDGKSYNIFKLSKRWENYKTQDFKPVDWKRFQPRVKRKATPICETDSSKIENITAESRETFSHFGVVGPN